MNTLGIVFLTIWLLAGFSSWWRLHHSILKWRNTHEDWNELKGGKSIYMFIVSPIFLIISLISGLISLIYLYFIMDEDKYEDLVWWHTDEKYGIFSYIFGGAYDRITYFLKYKLIPKKVRYTKLYEKEDW